MHTRIPLSKQFISQQAIILDLEGWYFKNDAHKGTVILFHGHGSSKSKLLHEAGYMHSLGFSTFLVDFRAHGGSDGNVCTIGYKESEDIKAAYDYIQQKGEKNIILWGISLGASTIIKAVHDYEDMKPRKLILEMPFGTLLQAIKGRMRTMQIPEQPLSTLLAFWGGLEQGFWAFSYKPCEYAKKITCPVLLQWGGRDHRVSRQEIDCIYNNISSADKKLVIYPMKLYMNHCTAKTMKSGGRKLKVFWRNKNGPYFLMITFVPTGTRSYNSSTSSLFNEIQPLVQFW